MGDLAAPCFAAQAILACLFRRERTAEGCHIDISMLDSILYLAPQQAQDALMQDENPMRARTGGVQRVFETSDGQHLQVMCPFPRYQEALRDLIAAMPGCDGLREPRFDTDQRIENMDAYWEIMDRAFRLRDQQGWIETLEDADIPCASVNTIGEALEMPQLRHRKMLTEVEIVGLERVPTLATPFRFSDGPEIELEPPPFLGQHTDEVLARVLGLREPEIADLHASGAFG
jgi:crotonobetainyl-CoA:carnitine CoA-transferase CaiB-like acyl-CoA transferase